VIQKINEKNEMPPFMFVGNLYKAHPVKCSKTADVHGKEVHDTLKICLFSQNFPIFITHNDCLRPTQNGEICLQQYPPISSNYLKQMLWLSNHLTTENNLKVEKKVILSKRSTTLPPEIMFGVRA